MVQIIPAIDVATEEEYKETLKKVEDSGLFEGGWVHIDFADNVFIPWKTVTPEIVKKYPSKLHLEAHLMVENPTEYLDGLEADRIIIHAELPEKRLEDGFSLALNPETGTDILSGFKPNVVLIMGVHPGKQGQEFMSDVLGKIKQIKEIDPGILVGVDGGVSPENAKLIVDAGADYLVIGSHLIEGNIDENLEKFWEAIQT